MSSPASWTTRGKDHPTARLSGPGPGQVWHRAQELAGRARKRLARRVPIATLDPLPRGSKNAIAYEPGNCPRATLGYRTPQKHSTNSLLPPIDTAGYALVDRLFAYPHARNLSTCEHESALPGIGGTSAPRTRGYSIVTPGPSGGRGPSISTGMRSSVPFGWTT